MSRPNEKTVPVRAARVALRLTRVTVRGTSAAAVLKDEPISIGSAEGNTIRLQHPTVSRFHAELSYAGDRMTLTDLGSTNGTKAGSVRVRNASVELELPGTFDIGPYTIAVETSSTELATFPAELPVPGLVGSSLVMRQLRAAVRALAASDMPVLVQGPSGAGKEAVARALHFESARSQQPFVVLDCGALAQNLLESELFGHEKGAFTGADQRHAGVFERAGSGTVFLDEIGDLPLHQQTALLGVLERREFRRVGGRETISLRARVVSATHHDLREAVNLEKFRSDLFYRLAGVRLRVPALKDRLDDIPELATEFLAELDEHRGAEEALGDPTLRQFAEHDWPGNVRELRNAVRAALFVRKTQGLELGGLVEVFDPGTAPKPAAAAPSSMPVELHYRTARDAALHAFERSYLDALLAASQGNIREAARIGRVDRTHLMEIMKRHGLR